MNNYTNYLNSHLSPFFTLPNLTRLQTIKDGSFTLNFKNKIYSVKTYEELKTRERVNPWVLSAYGVVNAVEEGDWDIFTRGIDLLLELGALEMKEPDYMYPSYVDMISGKLSAEINFPQLLDEIEDRGGAIQGPEDTTIIRDTICMRAALSNRFGMLKYASKKDFPCREVTLIGAVQSGNMEMIKWLVDNNIPCDTDVLKVAARVGNIEALKLFINQGCEPDRWILKTAVKHGKEETLQFLIDYGIALDEDIFETAVEAGKLNIAKILFENNCPWDKDLPLPAIRNVHIQMLKFLRSNGCPWVWKDFPIPIAYTLDPSLYPKFPEYRILKMMKWFYDNGELHDDEDLVAKNQFIGANYLGDYEYGSYSTNAIGSGYWEILQWLFTETVIEKGYIITAASKTDHLPTLKVIFESGDVGRECVLREQAKEGRIDNLKWLYENAEGGWDDYSLVLYGEYYREYYGDDEMLNWVEEKE